ncbi:HAD hydrolase-like protein [Streptomyces sp. NPDC047028]|uniref:HAD family hydrolase n=1 Tax=Streptomyces sp. NPDC047028 TaxID=3155793 RepID=UPI0033FC9680
MISHIFWDWNGTLADDAMALHHAVNAGMTAIGHAPVSDAQLREVFARPLSTLYERLTGADCPERWPVWHEAFLAAGHDKEFAPALAEDALEAVQRWHAQGRGQSVVSRWSADDLKRHVNATDLRYYMDGVRGATTLDEPKEHMLSQEAAVRGILPENALLIGDTVDDVEAARALGIAVIVCDSHSFTAWSEQAIERWQVPRVETLCSAIDLALGL